MCVCPGVEITCLMTGFLVGSILCAVGWHWVGPGVLVLSEPLFLAAQNGCPRLPAGDRQGKSHKV